MAEETSFRPLLYVVDNDSLSIETYRDVAAGLQIGLQCFSSVASFLAAETLLRPACVVSELVLGDQRGETLQDELLRRGNRVPVIFVAQSADVASAVRLMARGAMTLLLKPVQRMPFEQAVATAIELDRHQSEMESIYQKTLVILEGLSERQRLVLECVLQGLPTKTIAKNHGVSKRLVEMERSQLLKAFDVDGTPDLMLRMGEYRILNRLNLRADQQHSLGLRVPVLSRRQKSAEEGS